MDLQKTDPVIIDLIMWLKENLPPDVEEEAIFRKVRKIQKVFDVLIGLSFKEFYNFAITNSIQDDCPTVTTLEEAVSERLKDIREYIVLNEEKLIKTKKLNETKAKCDLEREHENLVMSIQLDGTRENSCLDSDGDHKDSCLALKGIYKESGIELIKRYNHLMSNK